MDFADAKRVDRPTAIRILDDVLKAMIAKKFGTADNFDIVINFKKGDLQILRVRKIVEDDSEDIWDPDKISLSEAQKIEADFGIGEEVTEEVRLESFNRRAVLIAKQTLMQRIKDLDRETLHKKYSQLVGQLITAEVYQVLRREVVLRDEDKCELTLPSEEQMPDDSFKKGQSIRAVISRVDLAKNNVKIVLSRSSNLFLEKLMEAEIPEILEGVVTIKQVARRPGKRAKVAVYSHDDRIDAVAVCVGMKGARIHGIINSIGGGHGKSEQIDIIHYTDNRELYIRRVFSPAKVRSIEQYEDRIVLHLDPDQIALAVGARGQNIHLASQLLGVPVDIAREADEQAGVHQLRVLEQDMGSEIIQQLHHAGLSTVEDILGLAKSDLKARTQMEMSTIDRLYENCSQVLDASPEVQAE